jgi:hypothetical protein
MRSSLFLHFLQRRLRWERRSRLSLRVLDRRWRERRHTRDVLSCLLEDGRSWRCRIATTGYPNRLFRHGRHEFFEGEGGEAPLLLLLLLLLLLTLLLMGFVTASWHGWLMKAIKAI